MSIMCEKSVLERGKTKPNNTYMFHMYQPQRNDNKFETSGQITN